jgi:MFS transporter, SHS family, sialic acid transporter
LGLILKETHTWLSTLGLPSHWVDNLVAHSGWRLLMVFGAAPALLTFFIRLFVPESKRWQHEKKKGTTSNWASRDLLGVGVGAVGASFMIYLRAADFDLGIQLAGAGLGLLLVLLGYTYPVVRYLQRSHPPGTDSTQAWLPTVRRMLLGACLGGVALLGTWASVQWAPVWADQLTKGQMPEAKAYTQIWSAFGAILGTMAGALMCNWFGRRIAYSLLCLSSLGSSLLFFLGNDHYGAAFLASMFLVGACTASFYGWLPLYLPELFTTGMRATGQGFSFNFGRILAAVGVLQTSNLMDLFDRSYPKACSTMSLIYLVGMAIIWLAPETRGKPLPE